MNVLLVEDDLALGDALNRALSQAGLRAVWVRRLKEARGFLASEAQDALLLDLGLPDGEGMSLLRELRGHGSTLPVLVLTARDDLESRLAGLHAGADDFLVKPFAIPELLALSPSEFALLFELARKAGKVVAREHLIDHLCCESDNALEVHVCNLRRKLGSDWVRTIRGVGYLLPRP